MSVKISDNKEDGINGVTICPGHPLGKTIDGNFDDVVYITIPDSMREEFIAILQRSIKENHPFHCLFSGDIKLRHNFVAGA